MRGRVNKSKRAARPSRRGVLLLVVLSLLVLFALIGVTYVVVAGQFRRASVSTIRSEQRADDFQRQLDDGFLQVVRGSRNPFSSIAPHSLLEDEYGSSYYYNNQMVGDSVLGTLAAAPYVQGNGQFIDLPVVPEQNYLTTLSQVSGFYNGCVLTMLSGPARGHSTRVVGYQYVAPAAATDPPRAILRVMAFEDIPSSNFVAGSVSSVISSYSAGSTVPPVSPPSLYLSTVGHKFLINGRPFSGTGFGYKPAAAGQAQLTATDAVTGKPHALLPNAAFFKPDTTAPVAPALPYVDAAGPGGANEDYDAADFQNMALAQIVTTGTAPLASTNIIPSFHRPALLNYFQAASGGQLDSAANLPLYRRISLRPIKSPTDHQYFTGSNPAVIAGTWNKITGPWDVDNDGDGVADSVWVDLGFPVLTAKDGRQYKRLYAFMCLDMDGRVNLNAHGLPGQADPATYDQPITGPFPGGNNTPVVPHGQGYGPAEIRLANVISANFAAGRTEFQNLLLGNQGLAIEGRYGEGATWATTDPVPGQTSGDQRLAQLKHFEFPNNYVTGGILTSYGTPCDLLARGIVALDFRGQPLFGRRAAIEWNNELNNSPYQLNLSGRGSKPAIGSSNAATPSTMTRGDNPFTVAELERVLRPLDIDSRSLPDRLLKLAPSLDGANSAVPVQYKANRFAVTSDSFDVPSPGAVATPDMRTVLNALNVPSKRGVNVVNMLAMKIIQANQVNGWTLPLSATNANNLAAELRKMLPPEVINGQRLNLNRALGNGRDDNTNGVVDEVEEAIAGQETTANNNVSWQTAYGNSLAFNLTDGVDVNNDGKVDVTDAKLARALQARYLFVLAMLLRDPQDYPTSEGAGAGSELAIRRLAQWAINVVDFRDADAAMTPFEYDRNPFNGWNVDGDLSTTNDDAADRRLVWGCESPEVVLTETLAFHDRRTADTDYEKASGKKYDDNGNGIHEPGGTPPEDPTLDQTRVPQGSAFFELYCARNPSNPIASADLYTYNTTDQKWRLDLGRLAGVDANNASGKQSSDTKVYPVWRMVITKSRIASANNDVRGRLTNKPDSTSLEPEQYRGATPSNGFSLLNQSTDPAVQIDRIVWFSTQAPNGHRDANLIYYNRTNNTQLLAGQYAVVGPRATTYTGSVNGNAAFGVPSPQKIRLLPTIDITDNNGTSVYPTNLNTDHPPMPIVCAGALPTQTVPAWSNGTATARVAPGGNGIGIGLSISEPLFSAVSYYPEPTEANANAGGVIDAYGDLTHTAGGGPFFKDQPLDSDMAANPPRPLLADQILGTGTQANYKTVFLQRLSNPLEAWDEVNNPYLTIDWLPIDLTVFNGEDSAAGKTVTPWDPDDPAPAAARFATRQRGSPRTFNAGTSTFNLWTSLADAPPATNLNGPATNNFRRKLDGTLGYLNLPFQDTSMATPWLAAADLSALPAPQNTEYIGDPRRPFPWLTWNNRPYTSAMEVMLVPGSSSGRLLSEFNIAPVGTPINLYDPAASSSYRSQWGHLLNFFHTSSAAPSPTGGSANLARMLEYLEVPSRFVGTETMLSPANITLPTTENGNVATMPGRLPNRDTENALLSFFHPPFNGVSNFRDPGRVNVNTIPTPQVFHALQNVPLDSGDPTKAAAPYDQWTTFQQFDESRRGYAGAFSPALPSEVGNPFRSAGSYDLVPLQTMVKATPINVTLLRANGVDPTNGNVPLFGVNHNNPAGQDDLYNTDRNPYFRYQQIQRLGNLTTTRSNVYAVWVTVGYFEVQPAPAGYDQDIFPDGYVLGQELGIDTGEVQRHRGFYIIDRTIPVGFQRGDDFNTDKAVLLKRFIE